MYKGSTRPDKHRRALGERVQAAEVEKMEKRTGALTWLYALRDWEFRLLLRCDLAWVEMELTQGSKPSPGVGLGGQHHLKSPSSDAGAADANQFG